LFAFVWEITEEKAFVVMSAFDSKRQAILLVAGNKSGVSEKRFYKRLISKSDARYNEHLKKLQDD